MQPMHPKHPTPVPPSGPLARSSSPARRRAPAVLPAVHRSVHALSTRGGRALRAAIVALLLLPFGSVLAQTPAALLEEGRAAVVAARDSGVIPTPDHPLWSEAIALGREALELAPDDPEAQRYLARVYSEVRWYIRAWDAWQRYLAAEGELNTEILSRDGPAALSDRELFAETGTELGFARYQAGQPDAAVPFYEGVLERLPENAEALRWLGRIHFEEGRPQAALPYWERLAALQPDDAGVAYYLDLTRQRIAVGDAAASSFQEGLERYQSGDLAAALEAFERAAAANDAFTEAFVWAGRSALESGRPAVAERYWARVVALEPGDGRARWFLGVARDQERWGVEAASDFYAGQAAYEAGDLEAARERFTAAATRNDAYLDAWVWAARASQELGEPAAAIEWWQGVLRLDPDDDRARYFLNRAEQQLEYGVEAGGAYAEAVRAWQLADFEAAEAGFRRAIEVDPGFAEAWGWLGQIAFAQGRYDEAARAYGRAADLDPNDEDYAFFRAEAQRLAGADESGEGGANGD